MRPMKTISVVAVSALAGLFVGQAHVALSKPKSQKPSQITVRSREYIIETGSGKAYGGMGASKDNGGLLSLFDPTSKVATIQEMANPPAIVVFAASAKNTAFIRFAFSKNAKTHVISPVIQMMDSSGKASEMDENGKVRPIKRPNPQSWWVPEH